MEENKYLRWEKSVGMFASGSVGYLGKAKVFSTHWNACKAKGSSDGNIILGSTLPSFKSDFGHFPTEDEAKVRAELIVKKWLQFAGLALLETI